jgi:hypothetical protein
MTAPVSLAEARLFLRATEAAEDGLIQTLIDAARARVEGEIGDTLDGDAPAALRLAILMLVLGAYERGGTVLAGPAVEAWIAPYRKVRL